MLKKEKQVKISASNIFVEALLSIDGKYFYVDKAEPAINKGAMSVSLCDLYTGISTNQNFMSKDKYYLVQYRVVQAEYWHPNEEKGTELFFDIDDITSIDISLDICSGKMGYIKSGIVYKILMSESNSILGIILPRFVELEVKAILQDNEANSLGNNVFRDSDAHVIAELETGEKISVPSYIERADIVKVDTRKRAYVQRF
ncbi:MAG: hypothetical protein KAH32_03685 [Chlamydiia bacterium]|nr:hypothetical protein [Chlamydiia bacterium]